MMQLLQRPLALILSMLLIIMPMAPLQAAIIGNETLINQAPSALTRDNMQELLGQESARQQMQAWGISPELITARINRLTDAELARINQETDTLKAGGTNVLGVLLIIFIVFVITDVIGATNIFPFIHPVK